MRYVGGVLESFSINFPRTIQTPNINLELFLRRGAAPPAPPLPVSRIRGLKKIDRLPAARSKKMNSFLHSPDVYKFCWSIFEKIWNTSRHVKSI